MTLEDKRCIAECCLYPDLIQNFNQLTLIYGFGGKGTKTLQKVLIKSSTKIKAITQNFRNQISSNRYAYASENF